MAFPSAPFDPHWSLHPRTYVAPYVPRPPPPSLIDIDPNSSINPGDPNNNSSPNPNLPWSSIPWSVPFDEIRGPADAPSGTRPNANCTTFMKMCWDSHYLYVLAQISSDMEVHAEYTERNSPIFQKDSDFEVFLDPAGCCHSYKELEINAMNTVWNLMLDKPYGNGGAEHSGRVAKPGEDNFYEVNDQHTATKVLRGKINDPPTPGEPKRVVWQVELALAHSDTLSRNPWGSPPKVGEHWRINFSRVEKEGEVNWTWQPQIAWDPIGRRFRGWVDMHRPDAWGYVVFGDELRPGASGRDGGGGEAEAMEEGEVARDPTWPARLAAMNVYYAQAAFAESNDNKFAPDLETLGDLVNDAIVGPFLRERGGGGVSIALLTHDGKNYVATVRGGVDGDGRRGVVVSVTNDRLVTVDRHNGGGDVGGSGSSNGGALGLESER